MIPGSCPVASSAILLYGSYEVVNRCWFLLFWSFEEKKRVVDDLLEYDDFGRCLFRSTWTCMLSQVCLLNLRVKWFFWGFSLAFSETGSKFIGDLSK